MMEISDPSEGEENCINFKRNDNGEIDFYVDARGTEPEPWTVGEISMKD